VVDAVSEEREELRRTVRAFLDDKSPESEVRRLMATDEGYDPAVWRQLAEQLGLQGLAIPEELGGHGYSFLELAVVLEEMGRALLCAPFFSSVALAATALLASVDDGAQKEHLPAIAAGQTIAAVALTEEGSDWTEAGVQLRAVKSGAGYRIDGEKLYVIDGHVADLILVAARTDAGVTLLAVPGDAAGLTRTPMVTMDATRKMARLSFDGTPATLVGADGRGWAGLRRTLDLAAAALASEQVGGAGRCLEMAGDYAKERVQFGRPIGSFQAVKHRCADMLVDVEGMRSATWYGAWAVASGDPAWASAAATAKIWSADASKRVMASALQVHGGIGFTWEHDLHLFIKRAQFSQLDYGDAAHHRAVLGASLRDQVLAGASVV
jgi:alkylation response protein AidB-like acyl-CoA dehydrogenase